MLKIRLFCAGGMSTSLLVTKMRAAAEEAGVEADIEAHGVGSIERRHGNYVMFSSNRLEYASNASKRNMVRDMVDRGVMSINEAREVLQLPPLVGGDTFFARGEYKDVTGITESSPVVEKDFDLGGDDDIYNDYDGRGEEDKFDG